MIRKKQPTDDIIFYWLTDVQTNRKISKRFQKTESFSIRGNFFM